MIVRQSRRARNLIDRHHRFNHRFKPKPVDPLGDVRRAYGDQLYGRQHHPRRRYEITDPYRVIDLSSQITHWEMTVTNTVPITLTGTGLLYQTYRAIPNTVTGSLTLIDPWPQWTTAQSTTQQLWSTWAQETVPVSSMEDWQWRQRFYVDPPEVQARRQEEAQRRIAAREAAVQRARTLLDSVLDEQQRLDLARNGHFFVRGSRGRRYCIRAQGQAGNVDWVDEEGRRLGTFCVHPYNGCPYADAWLTQMLGLVHDEDGVLAVANLTAGRRPDLVSAA